MKSALETINDFMEAWKNQDWGTMWENSQKSWRTKEENNAKMIFDLFGHKRLLDFEVVGMNEVSSCCIDVVIRIKYYINPGITQQCEIEPRLLKEIKKYHPSIDGKWRVNPISMLKEHDEIIFQNRKKPLQNTKNNI